MRSACHGMTSVQHGMTAGSHGMTAGPYVMRSARHDITRARHGVTRARYGVRPEALRRAPPLLLPTVRRCQRLNRTKVLNAVVQSRASSPRA
jgi:hypothetical protein